MSLLEDHLIDMTEELRKAKMRCKRMESKLRRIKKFCQYTSFGKRRNLTGNIYPVHILDIMKDRK